jgi:pimeloyl-ACP methyl ester carboxylesterase
MDRRHYLKLSLSAGLLAALGACGGATGDSTHGDTRMLIQRNVTTADGVRLNVVEAGNPSGPPIVFVHGISQSWLSWMAQLSDDGLRAKYRLIAFDLRGHGESEGSNVALDSEGKPMALLADAKFNDGNAASTSALWAGDLAAVISGLGLQAPLVVGWSYGGVVVADYIATNEGLGAVGKAMLLATSPVLLPPGTADGGADTVFSGATLQARTRRSRRACAPSSNCALRTPRRARRPRPPKFRAWRASTCSLRPTCGWTSWVGHSITVQPWRHSAPARKRVYSSSRRKATPCCNRISSGLTGMPPDLPTGRSHSKATCFTTAMHCASTRT